MSLASSCIFINHKTSWGLIFLFRDCLLNLGVLNSHLLSRLVIGLHCLRLQLLPIQIFKKYMLF